MLGRLQASRTDKRGPLSSTCNGCATGLPGSEIADQGGRGALRPQEAGLARLPSTLMTDAYQPDTGNHVDGSATFSKT